MILEIPMWKSKVGHIGQTCYVLAPYRKMKHEKKMRLPCKTKKQLPHYLQFLKHICFLNRCQLVSAVEARRGL